MSAREDLYLYAMVGKVHEDGNRAMAIRKLDAYRAEVVAERDAEIMRWLGKKAREYRATGWKKDAVLADVLNKMASQISRGAVRPNNTRLPAEVAPAFFEPGREYRATEHASLRFRCLTVDNHPDTGEARAFGWRMNNRTERWEPNCLDPDDWACCDWTEVTEDGAS